MELYKLKWTQLQAEIFSCLCMRAGEKFSQREIAGILKVSPTAVANSLKRLLEGSFVTLEKTKNIHFITLNRDNGKAIELKRAENLRNVYLSGLSDYLHITLAGSTIILFGSYSRGEDTLASDIDIAVMGRKEKPLQIEEYEKLLHRKINIQFYSSWKNIHEHLKNNILNGIVLHGGVEL